MGFHFNPRDNLQKEETVGGSFGCDVYDEVPVPGDPMGQYFLLCSLYPLGTSVAEHSFMRAGGDYPFLP